MRVFTKNPFTSWMLSLSLALVPLLGLAASGFAQTQNGFTDPLTPSQHHRVEQISTVFENSTTVFQYRYLEDIGDGAGITAGRIGFISASHGLYELVSEYVNQRPDSAIATYLPCLQSIIGTSHYRCLFPSLKDSDLETREFKARTLRKFDFGKAWMKASADPIMHRLQDANVETRVYEPTIQWTEKLGIKTALGFAIIFDTILQQGVTGINQLEGMAARAGDLKNGDEIAWLHSFLASRRQTQKRWFNPDGTPRSKDNPYMSYPRSDSLLEILNSGNLTLNRPIQFRYFGESFSF